MTPVAARCIYPAICDLFTLVDLRGIGETPQGEQRRFIAEAARGPTALPSQGVRWCAGDLWTIDRRLRR